MKRLISLAAACAAAISLSACSTESPVGNEASSDSEVQQVSADDILAKFDLSGKDGTQIIEELEQTPKDQRDKDLHASIRPDELILTADGQQASLPLPEDKFYVSIAPYLTQTHDCFNHSLTTCTGELSHEDIHVTITDDSGEELVNEDTTTHDNGFIGYWLPADKHGTITVTKDGKSGEVPLDTTDEGATCVTTLQMA